VPKKDRLSDEKETASLAGGSRSCEKGDRTLHSLGREGGVTGWTEKHPQGSEGFGERATIDKGALPMRRKMTAQGEPRTFLRTVFPESRRMKLRSSSTIDRKDELPRIERDLMGFVSPCTRRKGANNQKRMLQLGGGTQREKTSLWKHRGKGSPETKNPAVPSRGKGKGGPKAY